MFWKGVLCEDLAGVDGECFAGRGAEVAVVADGFDDCFPGC